MHILSQGKSNEHVHSYWVCGLSYQARKAHAPYSVICNLSCSTSLFYVISLTTQCSENFFWGKHLFWFSPQTVSETFLILRRIQRDIITNANRSSGKVSVIHTTFEFSWQLFENTHLILWKSAQNTIRSQSSGNRIQVHCRAVARSNSDICQPEDDVLISGDLYRKTMWIRNWKMSCLLRVLLTLNFSSPARVPHPIEQTASANLKLHPFMKRGWSDGKWSLIGRVLLASNICGLFDRASSPWNNLKYQLDATR